MARGNKRRPQRAAKRKRTDTRPQPRNSGRRSRTDREPDLLADVRAALAGDHPLELLGMVSSVLAALDPRPSSPFEPTPAQESITVEELVQSFIDVELPETSALLAVIAELTGDDVMRARIRRALAGRPQVLPRWLQQLADARVGPAVELVHVLGDGDNVMVGVTLPDG
ncbi:MAG: hypothetical protein H0W37_10630, partial [Pseudonocardiales bacterium]|nr:hypothetical protein [Pseudonocardiales bacterium]